MKNMSMKALSLLILLTTLRVGAYTFRICYNGSQDPTDTNVPEAITLHSHVAGGSCWAKSLPDLNIAKEHYQEVTVQPDFSKASHYCNFYPEHVNGAYVKPWAEASWPLLKPTSQGQTWQIFKTKEPKTVQKIRSFDPRKRAFTEIPIQASWFATIQDGIQECRRPPAPTKEPVTVEPTKAPTKKPIEKQPINIEKRRVKAAGILPYCVDPTTGQVKVLIGKGPTKHSCLLGMLTCSMDKWADFGGSVEEKDYTHHKDDKDAAIKETAAREIHEETMGYFTRTPGLSAQSPEEATKMALEETKKGIDFWTSRLKEENRVKTEAGYDYWFVEIPCTPTQTSELRDLHNKLYSNASYGSNTLWFPWVGGAYFLAKIDSDIEKIDFRWVPAENILEQIDATKSDPKKPLVISDPEDSSKTLELYYRFEKSLREGKQVLERINESVKKRAKPQPEKTIADVMKTLNPEEQAAFINMITRMNEIKKQLIQSLENYKNALANKNKEAIKEIAQEMSDQLTKITVFMTQISNALKRNTALGMLMKDRLSPAIKTSLHTTAQQRSSIIMNALQDMLYGITLGVQKTIKIARWPLASYYLSEHWNEIDEDPRQAFLLAAGVTGTIGLLDGLASMLKRGPDLKETPAEVLEPFELEIAQANQAEESILKMLEQKPKP